MCGVLGTVPSCEGYTTLTSDGRDNVHPTGFYWPLHLERKV